MRLQHAPEANAAEPMGKCVSRQTTETCRNSGSRLAACRAAHHQSVLTIALSQPDLAQAHKIWQQLTASNEYIEAATASPAAAPTAQEVATLAEPPFYYHISRNKAEKEQQQEQAQAKEEEQEQAERQAEAVQLQALRPPQHAEWEAKTPPASPPSSPSASPPAAALLHIDAVYNHLDAHANAKHVIAAALTACNSNNNSDNNCDSNYATCQELLLLVQALEEYQVKNITSTFTANGDCQLRANDSDSSVAAQEEEQQEEQEENQEEEGEQHQQPQEVSEKSVTIIRHKNSI